MTRPRIAIPFGLLGLVIVGLLVTGTLLWPRVSAAEAAQLDRERALAAARQQGINMITLDYRTIDRDIQRVLTNATGRAKDEYAALAGQIKNQFTKTKAVSQGSVVAIGIASIDRDDAQVLVAADATVRNEAAGGAATQRPFRWIMEVTKVGDRWIVSKVEVAP